MGGKGFHIGTIPRLRVGIDYVPYDDFPALLHKGEAVLTASENQNYQGQKSVDENQKHLRGKGRKYILTVTSTDSSPSEISKTVERLVRRLKLEGAI